MLRVVASSIGVLGQVSLNPVFKRSCGASSKLEKLFDDLCLSFANGSCEWRIKVTGVGSRSAKVVNDAECSGTIEAKN